MDKLTLGILAHVDAGKTTLSEAMLYCSGRLKKLGRVDYRDAFLDTEPLERERGITIFSKQAILPLPDVELTLLDTPGHVDFSSETERCLQILDCAILVISGTDGVQSHTQTLWELLRRHNIPTIIFVNKMDLAGSDRSVLDAGLKGRLSDCCVDFGLPAGELFEAAAMCGEDAMESYLDSGTLTDTEIATLVGRCALFPCFYGSALKLTGVDELLYGLSRYIPRKNYPAEFGARVFKITRDRRGTRMSWMKITGGSLRVKSPLTLVTRGGEQIDEKPDQLRIYSGAKFTTVDEATAGTVCAVTGLDSSFAGQGLGFEREGSSPELEPVLSYRVELPEGCDAHDALGKLRQLEEEDPQLRVTWDEQNREIHLQLMGEVQLEVLRVLIHERFGLAVDFGEGGIVYRETITAPVLGAGHFEPLRHYAEVHLLLEPGERGSGMQFYTSCSEDVLDRSWQRLILTHLEEKAHIGVLIGAPLTDMAITLIAGRAHIKHTEGGDFRQATYRAVRQGLMKAQSAVLEPWYSFRIELPTSSAGRAISDIQRMSGAVAEQNTLGDYTVLTGRAPVSELRGYSPELSAYTHGLGRMSCTFGGYELCHNQDEVIAAAGYEPERDLANPADSVFCSHGAGVTVAWDEADGRMHLDAGSIPDDEAENEQAPVALRGEALGEAYVGSVKQDKELLAIFERTYGPVKRRDPEGFGTRHTTLPERVELHTLDRADKEPEYLLVDGYNIIFAWDELSSVAEGSLDSARKLLMDILCNYQGVNRCRLILVFDAYKVVGGVCKVERYHNITVVYTGHAETADQYIEKATYELSKNNRVRVATSDGTEQIIIIGHGAHRQSAAAFHEEVLSVSEELRRLLARINAAPTSRAVEKAFIKAQTGRHRS